MFINTSRVIRAMNFHCPPWNRIIQGNGNSKDGYVELNGVSSRIFYTIMDSLHLKYVFVHQEDHAAGLKCENGSWNGMAGTLEQNLADMTINPMANAAYKLLEVVQFTNGLVSTNVVLVGSSPAKNAANVAGFLWIFHKEVWLALSILMLTMVLVSGIKINKDQEYVTIGFVNKNDFQNVIFSYVSALFMEGTPRTPPGSQGRTLHGLWWLVVLLLGNAFCGLFKANMMVGREGEKVKDLEHLSRIADKIKPLIWKNTAYEMYFRSSNSSVHKKIMQAVNKYNTALNPIALYEERTLSRVVRMEAVIVNERIKTFQQIGEKCSTLDIGNFYASDEIIFPHELVFGVSKNFDPYLLKLFNRRIRWLHEANIIEKWVDDEYRSYRRCTAQVSTQDVGKPLVVQDVTAIFLLYLVCQAIAIFVFVLEIITNLGIVVL